MARRTLLALWVLAANFYTPAASRTRRRPAERRGTERRGRRRTAAEGEAVSLRPDVAPLDAHFGASMNESSSSQRRTTAGVGADCFAVRSSKCSERWVAPQPPYSVSVVAVIKNDVIGDANRTRDWLEYHRLVGVQHFYVAVNDCHDAATEAVLGAFGDWVSIDRSIECKEKSKIRRNLQKDVYLTTMAAIKASNASRTLLFIDSDEYVGSQGYSLQDAARDLAAQNDALLRDGQPARVSFALRWRDFGTSLHSSRLRGSLLASNVLRLPLVLVDGDASHAATQSAASRYAKAHEFNEVHLPKAMVDTRADTSMRNLHTTTGNDVDLDETKIFLNHYQYKSVEDYGFKKKRGFMASEGASHWGQPPPFFNYFVDASAVRAVVQGVDAAVRRGDLLLAEASCVATQLLCHDAFQVDVVRDLENVAQSQLHTTLQQAFPAFHEASGGGSWWPVNDMLREAFSREPGIIRAPASAALKAAVDAAAPPDKLDFDAHDGCTPAELQRRHQPAPGNADAAAAECSALDAALRHTTWAWCHNGVTQNGMLWFRYDNTTQQRFVENSFRHELNKHVWAVVAPNHVHLSDVGGAGPADLFFGKGQAGFAANTGKSRGFLTEAPDSVFFSSPDEAGAPCAFE